MSRAPSQHHLCPFSQLSGFPFGYEVSVSALNLCREPRRANWRQIIPRSRPLTQLPATKGLCALRESELCKHNPRAEDLRDHLKPPQMLNQAQTHRLLFLPPPPGFWSPDRELGPVLTRSFWPPPLKSCAPGCWSLTPSTRSWTDHPHLLPLLHTPTPSHHPPQAKPARGRDPSGDRRGMRCFCLSHGHTE